MASLWARITAFFMSIIAFFSGLFGINKKKAPELDYNNLHDLPGYDIPADLAEYTRIDTAPKTDWSAKYIRDSASGTEENVWMCLRKTVELDKKPDSLTAYISADSRYWLYINGELVVFEGSAKRGPTPTGSYYATVEIGPYLQKGKNVICALVWYWGKDSSYSSRDSGEAGFLFEAGSIISDGSWKARRNTAYKKDTGSTQPNYRLPESNIYYDAGDEVGDWLSPSFDDSSWSAATVRGVGGSAPWGTLYPRGIPLLKDFGLKDYENSAEYKNVNVRISKKLTLNIPYNAQCTPYLKVDAKKGKKIKITTENTGIGSVCDTYVTKGGVQEFEALGWFNGEHITYEIPSGVKILELKYRETGYDTSFSGAFECEDRALNLLWQKSLRTLYVTMRDNFMDCPDRERAQWWGDVTNEMAMMMYSLDPDAYFLYQKGVAAMLGHIDPSTKVLQTVVPIDGDYFELPMQQLAGVCGFWTYYTYTGDREFLNDVYGAALDYVKLWSIGGDNLVVHRGGSWDWMDWGEKHDVTAIENAWYYYALQSVANMAGVLGKDSSELSQRMQRIKSGYESLWTSNGYKSSGVSKPDDRANALAVISGLAGSGKYDTIASVLGGTENASPYMEYYVLDALCKMGRYSDAKARMLRRYGGMIQEDYSTLWEHWNKAEGTLNHAWSGGPLVIMSKYFAGVRPVGAGYGEYVIKPLTDVCSRVNCVVPSVKGYIRLNAQKNGSSATLDVTLPANAKANIYVPCTEGQTVLCGGEAVLRGGSFLGGKGLSFKGMTDGCAVFSVSPPKETQLRFEAVNG